MVSKVADLLVLEGDNFDSYLGGRPVASYFIEVTYRGSLIAQVEVGSETTSYVQTGLSPQTSYK